MREVTSEPARVKPDRKWFGNIRTVDQKQLDKYKAEVALQQNNPYDYLLKARKVDLEIFNQPKDYKGSKLTDVETFEETFGPQMRR